MKITPLTHSKTISKLRKAIPWLLLAAALSVFYDLTPFTHLPLPHAACDSWASLTKPTLTDEKYDPTNNLVTVQTNQGAIDMHYYPSQNATTGLVMVGGIGTGFDSPASEVYERLGKKLTGEHVSAVHLCFRHVDPLSDTVHDVRAAVKWLNKNGIKNIIVIGHSLGGASVISAASYEPSVVGVAALCSQPYGADRVRMLADRNIFVGAGIFDIVEPPCWSSAIYRAASGNKELHYYPAIHTLHSSGDTVYADLLRWIRMQ